MKLSLKKSYQKSKWCHFFISLSDFPTSIQLTELLHLYNIEISNLSYWSEVVSRLCSFFVDICRTLSSREPVTPIVVLDLCIYSSKSSGWCTITSNIQNAQCHMHNFQRFIKYMLIIVCLASYSLVKWSSLVLGVWHLLLCFTLLFRKLKEVSLDGARRWSAWICSKIGTRIGLLSST